MGLPMRPSQPLASAVDRCNRVQAPRSQAQVVRPHNQRLLESSLLSSRLCLAPWMPTAHGSRSVGNSGFAPQATSVSAAPFTARDVPQLHFLDTFGVSPPAKLPEELLERSQHHVAASAAVTTTPDPPPAITIRFEVPEFVTAPGERLVICGSVPALGSWELESGACLTWSKGHRWTGEIELEPGWHGALEFKVALVNHNTHIWEPGSNRLLVVERPRSGKQRRLGGVHQTSVDDLDASEAQGPLLQVQCEWGKAEAPNAPLPPSLLCSASTPGRLANGQALGVPPAAGELSQAQATLLAGSTRRDDTTLVMANCQVVVPWLEPRLAAGAVAETSGAEGLHLILVGSVPGLGCWDPAQGLRLAADDAGMWRGRLELPMGYSVQAKLALWDSVKGVVRTWEPGGNRTFRLPEAPASMLGRVDEAHASGSPAADGSPVATRSTTQGNGVQRTMSRVGPWPVMPDGEFMLLTHWGTPGFPHLVFLPSIDSLSSSVRLNKRPATVMCRFTVPHLPTSPNQHLLLVGSTPKLGNWDPTRGLRLQWGPGHSWQAGVHLPAEDGTVEAKVVLWDGAAYRWEPGPNRQMRPGQLIADVAPTGSWGEVLHILYWGGTQEAGRTPAVVIPQDVLLASVGPGSESATASSSGSSGSFSRRSSDSGAPGLNGSAAGGTNNAPVEPGLMMLQLMASLAAMALHAGETGTLAAAGEPLGSTPLWVGVGAGPHRASGANLVVSSLEATAEALRAQLAETHAARQRDVDSLRQQVAEANKALAMEEDEVESLHCQLGSRTAELRNLQQQLARAEATAAAAVAAATTALSSASSMYAAANNGSTSVSSGELSGRSGAADPSGGNLPGVAAATFQKLTEQLAVLQLEADMARRALTEAHAARSSEVAHLRSELSEAVAWRHKDAEAARLATSALTLAHQQEVARLHSALADTQRARQRDMTALQARLEAVAAASAGETSRLVRQLAQACAAAEALETQLMRQSSHTASGGTEMRRLRGLLSSQASELESLKGQLADGHAAAAVGLFSPASPLVDTPDQDGTSPADHLLVGSNQADMLLGQSSHDLPQKPTASDVLPGQLASVMTEVRAAKAALEQLSSSGQSFVNSVTASVGMAAMHGTSMANGVEDSSSSNGTSAHRVNGNGHQLNGHQLSGTWPLSGKGTGPSNNITVFLHQQHKKRGNGAERSHSVEPDSDNEKE